MNFEEEEDWDLELIDNLVRKEEEAIAAKRSSQAVPPVSQPPLPFLWSGLNNNIRKEELDYSSQQHHHQQDELCGSASVGTQNDLVVSELRQRLFQAEQEVNELRKKVLQPAVFTPPATGQEFDRLRAQILFKDQEILEIRRAFAEKSEQLKKVTNEVGELRKRFEGQSQPVNRQLDDNEEVRLKQKGRVNNGGIIPPRAPAVGVCSQVSPNQDLWYPPWKLSEPPELQGHASKSNKSSKSVEPSLVGELKFRTRSNGCTPSFQKEVEDSVFQAQKPDVRASSFARDCQTREENNKDQFTAKRTWKDILPGKLFKIWCSNDIRGDNMKLISKLFTVCLGDMQVLLSFDASKGSSKGTSFSVNKVGSDMFMGNVEPRSGASEEPELHSILFKMANRAVPSWTFFMAVLDLSDSQNIQVCESALNVLHCILLNDESCRNELLGRGSSWLPTKSDQGGLVHANVFGVDSSVGASSKHFIDLHTAVYSVHDFKVYSSSPRVYWSSSKCKVNNSGLKIPPTLSEEPYTVTEPVKENHIRIFERILCKATQDCNQATRIAAMSILIVLVMNAEAVKQRESFGFVIFDGSISALLRQSASVDVRLQAVRLLYNLLHCPGVLKKLCIEEEQESGELSKQSDIESRISSFEVLNGLISCLLHNGRNFQEYSLRRNALRVLTFIATSGQRGAIFLLSNKKLSSADDRSEELKESENQKGPSRVASGSLPLQLVYLLDEELQSDEEFSNVTEIEERECMIRETLTLLCRLASHSAVNVTTLEALTTNKALARLSISVTNRLINRGALLEALKLQGKHDVLSSADLIELARGLRRTILASVSNSES